MPVECCALGIRLDTNGRTRAHLPSTAPSTARRHGGRREATAGVLACASQGGCVPRDCVWHVHVACVPQQRVAELRETRYRNQSSRCRADTRSGRWSERWNRGRRPHIRRRRDLHLHQHIQGTCHRERGVHEWRREGVACVSRSEQRAHALCGECMRRSEKRARMAWRVRALCEPWVSHHHKYCRICPEAVRAARAARAAVAAWRARAAAAARA
jgi:hypothetical protein